MAGNAAAADGSASAALEASSAHASKTIHFDPSATISRGEARSDTGFELAPLQLRQFSDLEGGRGPDPHVRELGNIAAAAAFGNRDAVEITSSSLRRSGVTREDIQEAIDWTKVHHGPARLQPQGAAVSVDLNASSVWVVSY
jgi:hypothetical protein